MTTGESSRFPGDEGTMEVRELVRRQESLRQTIESISGELELRPLLPLLVRHACELTGAAWGAISLVEPDRTLARTEAVYGLPPPGWDAETPHSPGLTGQPLPGELSSRRAQPAGSNPDRSATLSVPICWRGTMTGLFEVGAAPASPFGEQDGETLTIFARHAAIAIENARMFEAEKRRSARVAMIEHVGRVITRSLNLDQLLQTTVEAIAGYLHYPNVAILLVDPSQADSLVLRASSGIYALTDLHAYRQRTDQGLIGAAIEARQRLLVNDVRSDLRYLAIPGGEKICTELVVPIAVGDRLLGVLNIESEWPMSPEDADGFETVADQLGVAIDNARLFAETQGALDQARRLYETSHERGNQIAVLQERQRLARELHDSVTQLLFSITLIAQSIGPAWRRNPAEGERRVNRLLELSQSALAEMRILLAELRPSRALPAASPESDSLAEPAQPASVSPGIVRLPVDGLVEVLRRHAEDLAQDGLRIILDAHDYTPQAPNLEEALYRITQEALNNVIKHARARTVRIKLSTYSQATWLLVTDDGVGFTRSYPGASPPGGGTYRPAPLGLGLSSMRERAEALGGTVQLSTAPDAGTTVIAIIPRKDRLP